jgi:1,2-diacylglycerol 3-glucosyltransferase
MKKKVMILTVSTGGGHNKASKVIQNELNTLGINNEIVDALKDVGTVGKALDIVVSGGYEKSAQYIPKVYGKVYDVSDQKIIRKTFDYNFVITYMERTIRKKIENDDITHIISTHPFTGIAVSRLKEKEKIDIPLYSLITDYTVHLTHVTDEIDKYIVAHEDTVSMLEDLGVSPEKIYPFGIPTDMKDYSDDEIKEFKKENSIDDRFTVLVVGGSFGAGNIKAVYKQLLKIDDINIIIICGRNEALRERLQRKVKYMNKSDSVKIVGFTNEIEKYYQSSNIIVTKPGGLTVTECIQKGLPMIIPFYIPGQEEGNKDFVVNNQMGLYSSKYYTLSVLVKTLMKDNERVKAIKEAMIRNRKENSAKNIAGLVI